MPTMEINLMLGLVIMFSLSFLMTYLTYKDVETFFIFLTIFSGFVVWSGLIDLWILILTLIILVLIMANNISKGRID